MSEERQIPEYDPEITPDPIAIGIAIGKASSAIDDEVIAFLRDQRQHLHEQFRHLREQLRLRLWEQRLGVLLRIATAFTGFAVAAGLAYLIWNAANSNDPVINSFQVPPDLAARGLSGPVVAAKLSDRIAAMQAQTTSTRPPRSYANGLSDGLKLDIPETGVSLSELDRFLRAKLGHDLHIGGEMVQQDKGTIALTARVGTDGSATVTGAETDMDSLLQKLAEQVYRTTQPYRFSVWLQRHGRVKESAAVLKELAASGPPGERAWAYNGLAVVTLLQEGQRASTLLLRRGLALDPDNFLLIANLGVGEIRQGRVEDGIRYYRMALAALSAHGKDYTPPDRVESTMHAYNAILLTQQGAFLESAGEQRANLSSGILGTAYVSAPLAEVLAALHEPAAAGAALAEYSLVASTSIAATSIQVTALHARQLAVLEAQDWAAVPAAERDFAALTAQIQGFAADRPTLLDPFLALALAHMGQFPAAEARLKAMPGDCYPCLRARAQVAALQGQNARADWWFARAAAVGPSLPFAHADWGQALLARGQPDAAIEKFKLANQKSPHFADPLEGWGEALMAENQSHLALAKFVEAEKYAPNWGRLHLKWGEALYYAGKKDDAKKQLARAAQVDLPASDKAELARWMAPRGS